MNVNPGIYGMQRLDEMYWKVLRKSFGDKNKQFHMGGRFFKG